MKGDIFLPHYHITQGNIFINNRLEHSLQTMQIKCNSAH